MDRIFSILNGVQSVICGASVAMQVGDRIKNINSECTHFGSEGFVEDIQELPDYMGYIVSYRTTNSGPTWAVNQVLKKTKDQLSLMSEGSNETDEIVEEFDEYKNELMGMSVSALKAIKTHVDMILSQFGSNENVRKNLTETWLQGKIAVVDDQLRSIHDFVMYADENDDTSEAGSKPGLWENIRKKKEREGKDYKPAKRGDPDRPDPKQWKRLTK